jgi:hypothetical protein
MTRKTTTLNPVSIDGCIAITVNDVQDSIRSGGHPEAEATLDHLA